VRFECFHQRLLNSCFPGGGTELDNVGGGLGEPLNVIISGLSDPRVLTTSGFTNYAEALGFAPECLGIHSGAPQCANLGDGQGCVNQLLELRDDYGSSAVGTCLETLVGGNHLRYAPAHRDSSAAHGPAACSASPTVALSSSRAYFRGTGMCHTPEQALGSVSYEENVTTSHTIEANGYNIGR
jgi:hypothetical protein